MLTLSVEQVAAQITDLLLQVQGGEEISIQDSAGNVVARLTPPRRFTPRIAGLDAETVKVADDFNSSFSLEN